MCIIVMLHTCLQLGHYTQITRRDLLSCMYTPSIEGVRSTNYFSWNMSTDYNYMRETTVSFYTGPYYCPDLSMSVGINHSTSDSRLATEIA